MKKIIILICTIFLIIIIWLGYTFFNTRIISIDEAKNIALKDLSNEDGEYTFNSSEYNQTDNLYIIKFSDKFNNYTYKINAKSKKIISSKKEPLINIIDEEEILNIIFKHANLNKKECDLISNSVTIEKGIPFYNTIFYYKNIRYEYKTNAYTGSILSVIKLNMSAK